MDKCIQIQQETAATSYWRTIDQISKTLKKLKKVNRDQKKDLDRCCSGRPWRISHFNGIDLQYRLAGILKH